MDMFFRFIVIVSTIHVISGHFGLSCRDVILTFSKESGVNPSGGAVLRDNSAKRRRSLLVVHDVILDLPSDASWLLPSSTYSTGNDRRSTSNDTAGDVGSVSPTSTVERALPSPKRVDVCRRLRLSHRMCAGEDGATIGRTLMESIRLSAYECRRQFQFDRWNCSVTVDAHRIALLDRGLRASSFLHAISSATIVHTVARACSRGHLTGCTCDRTQTGITPRQHQSRDSTWQWAGCGDNVRYASRLAVRVAELHGRRSTSGKRLGDGGGTSAELLSRIDDHNYKVGIKIVSRNLNEICKCHGVSGSCSLRTCWRQLIVFPAIGNQLRTAYDRATSIADTVQSLRDPTAADAASGTTVAVASTDLGQLGRKSKASSAVAASEQKKVPRYLSSGGRPLRPAQLASSTTLVYGTESPDFCERSTVSFGTRNRHCATRTTISGSVEDPQNGVVAPGDDRCDELCCGRGYNVRQTTARRRCRCHVVQCCSVKCDECLDNVEIYTCK